MTLPPFWSILLRLLPCLIPPYALRLTRAFGTKRVGWVLFAAFSLLAAMQLMRSWQPSWGLDPEITTDVLSFLVTVMLLVAMMHMESFLRERRRLDEEEKRLRGDLENQVRDRTAALDLANSDLQREISLRKQGEEELRQSKERYRFLFDENPQPMWIYDLETFRFLAFNTAVLRRYGFSAAEFRELTARDLCPNGEVQEFLGDSAKTRLGELRHGFWRHCKKDGSQIEVEVTALGLVYSARPARLVLTSDVTAQRQLQRQMLQAQKLRVTAQIAGGVADRFSRLMAALESETASLAETAKDAAVHAQAKRIAATATGASGLTRQLLALVGRHPMQSRMVNLNQMIENQMETRGLWAANKIEVRTMYGDNLPLIAGDPELLQQIVHNLVTNAREAMPEGGCLTLRTAALMVDAAYARRHEEARQGAFVCLQVSDTGCGMSAEVQARLFEPFFTTKKTSKSAGLGLASVYGLLKQHNGWIEVSSQLGSGTTMTVFFPCGPSPSAPKTGTAEVCDAEAGAADGTVVAVG